MKNFFKGLCVFVLALLGAFMSRWHGGGFIGGSPKILKAFLWSLPFALVNGAAWFIYPPTLFWGILWATVAVVFLAVLIWSMIFKNTGHGGGMDMAKSPKEPDGDTPETKRSPEKLEYLILWLHPKMPRYWYDALLLAVIGAFSTAGAVAGLAFINTGAAAIVLFGGAAGKSLGYMIGHAAKDAGLLDGLPYEFDHATAIGESLAGLFAYAALGIAAAMIFFAA